MLKQITDRELLDLCEAGVEFILNDPLFRKTMDQSSVVSLAERFVDHGYEHAVDVWTLTGHVIALSPNSFSQFFRATALAAALLHDVGRTMGGKDHAKNGAKIARQYLEAIRINGRPLPRAFINRVVFIVRNHRSESWLNRKPKRQFDGPDVVVVLISDKLSGTEARLTEEKLTTMKMLAGIYIPSEFRDHHHLDKNWSLARLSWNRPDLRAGESPELVRAAEELMARHNIATPDLEIDQHDQVNGSIYERDILLTADGQLRYCIKVDERLAPRELVTGLDWWRDALHLASVAAEYLGLRFMLEFNGQLFSYSQVEEDWLPQKIAA